MELSLKFRLNMYRTGNTAVATVFINECETVSELHGAHASSWSNIHSSNQDFSHLFIESEILLSFSQEHATGSYPEEVESNPHCPTLSLWRFYFFQNPSFRALVFQMVSSFKIFLSESAYGFFVCPVHPTCRTHLIVLDFVILIQIINISVVFPAASHYHLRSIYYHQNPVLTHPPSCEVWGFHGGVPTESQLNTLALKMETACFSETFTSTNQSTRRLHRKEYIYSPQSCVFPSFKSTGFTPKQSNW